MDPLSLPQIPVSPALDNGQLAAIRRMDPGQGRAAAARELQLVFFTQLIEAMRRTVPDGSLLPRFPGKEVYEGLFDRELAQALVVGDPLGIEAALAAVPPSSNEVDVPRDHPRVASVPPDARGATELVVAPVLGRLSSPYGPRYDPISGRRHMHRGIDLAAAEGSPVRTVAAGRVVASGWSGAAGRRVIVAHPDGYRTVYAHAGRTLVRKDDAVVAGQVIATVGSSGRATGPHLHFEVHRNGVTLDPARAGLTAGAVRRAVGNGASQEARSSGR